jgi:hypothetical protein
MRKVILTIELVPSSSWLNNVRAIVTDKQWNSIKSSVYSKAYYMCEICGEVGPNHPVECHEIWTYDDKSLIQKLEGMISLCPNCHMVKHIGLAQIQGRFDKALKHFMRVNGLGKDKAVKLIDDSFKIWRERSNKKWKLDLSHLSEYGLDVESLVKSK